MSRRAPPPPPASAEAEGVGAGSPTPPSAEAAEPTAKPRPDGASVGAIGVGAGAAIGGVGAIAATPVAVVGGHGLRRKPALVGTDADDDRENHHAPGNVSRNARHSLAAFISAFSFSSLYGWYTTLAPANMALCKTNQIGA